MPDGSPISLEAKTLLEELVAAGLLTKRFTRNPNQAEAWAQSFELQAKLTAATNHLPQTCSMSERLMNLRRGITKVFTCKWCGASLAGKPYHKDYAQTCGKSCALELAIQNRSLALNEKDDLGQTLAQRIGKKVAASLRSQMPDGRSRAQHLNEKSLRTKEALGQITKQEQRSQFKQYNIDVVRFTKRQPIWLLEHADKRAVCGHHIDHRFSITAGFNEGVDPSDIGHIANLTMLDYKSNVRKSSRCSISIDELLERITAYNRLTDDEARRTFLAEDR